MVNNQFNMLTRIKRYFRIVTISCIMPISILGGRVSINQVGAEESLAEEYPSEISSGVTLSESTLPVEELDRNVALPNVPVLPNRVIYRIKDHANLLGALSTGQMTDLLGNSNNRVERISPLLTQELLANSREIEIAPLARTFVVTLSPTANVENTIQTLSQLPFIEYAERDQLVQVNSIPNDPNFGQQWNLDQGNDADIDAPEAWDINTAIKYIKIAILDTGVEEQHIEFKNKFFRGSNFTSDDTTQWNDGHGHGTHVAGIAAAKTDNGTGVAGVCWGKCQIMPVKVLTDGGWGYYSWIAQGIYYAAQNSVKVINLSLGSATDSQTLHDAIQYAYNKRVTIVAAAGNDGGAVLYPAAYPETIAVAATDDNDNIPGWSNQGSQIDLAAPGASYVLSTYLDNGFAWMRGTSMAAPHVAGAAALLQSFYRQTYGKFLKPEQVRCYLQKSADDLGLSLNKQGAGRLNLKQLLLLVVDPNFVACD
jgi:thermitase